MPWGEPLPTEARGVEPPFAPTFIRHERLSEEEFRRQYLGEFDRPPFSITGDYVRDLLNIINGFDWCYVEGWGPKARQESERRIDIWKKYRRDVLNYYKENPPMPGPDMSKIAQGARVVEDLAKMNPRSTVVTNALDVELPAEEVVCMFCLASVGDDDQLMHSNDCLWIQAREVFPQS